MSAFELIRSEAAKDPQQRKTRASVRRLCTLLDVSPSGYYDWLARKREAKEAFSTDERLIVKARAVQRQTGWVYGSRRLRIELNAQGEKVGRRRIRRLCREYDLFPIHKKRFRKTTDSDHQLGYSPNLLGQDFTAGAPNEVWVSDITYIWTGEGWCYLATVIDLYSRRIVGWAVADNMRAQLVVRALQRAIELRSPQAGLIVHTDRGSQYASAAYRKLLKTNSLRQSMSGTGSCYDNAVAESFFASLKKECVSRKVFATRTEAFDAIAAYIEGFYNSNCRHSTLGYVSPISYESNVRLPEAA
ncbi:MAG: IS3 family transposase [Polyangiaceae bacterium]